VRTCSDVVDRVAALQAFHAGRDSGDPHLDPHPGGAGNVLRVAEQLYRIVDPAAPRAADPATSLMQALLEAFPDRVARLRPGAQDRGTMVGGRGVRLDAGSRVRGEPLFLAIDIDDAAGEAGVRQASAIERDWLDAGCLAAANLRTTEDILFHPSRRQVEARRRTAWMDLVLDETPIAIGDADAAAAVLAREAAAQWDRVAPAPDTAAGGFLARARWLMTTMPDLGMPALDDAVLKTLLPDVCRGLRTLEEVRAADWLSRLQALVGSSMAGGALAPPAIELPTGKRHRLVYDAASPPVLAVRIQELFGLAETPRVAGGRVPVLLHLLGPNHRPQQVTADLAGFWASTYPRIRQELRRRYPKHAWPDDPRAAAARKP
jgi:ATP-dependent helicase HrpB